MLGEAFLIFFWWRIRRVAPLNRHIAKASNVFLIVNLDEI